MRRILFVLVTGFTLGMLAGCHSCGGCGNCHRGGHTHGICDCDQSEDPCYTRAPWAGQGAPVNGTVMPGRPMPSADQPKR